MNKYIAFIIISLLFSEGLFAQQSTTISLPTIDFFKDQKKLLCWNGPLSSSHKDISAAPLMHYFDAEQGSARIICRPNYGFDKWQALIRKVGVSNEFQRVREIALNKNEARDFTIYAFFMEAKYLVELDEKPYFKGEKAMEFPAPLSIFKREGEKWIQIGNVHVKNDSAFLDLLMKYAVGTGKFL